MEAQIKLIGKKVRVLDNSYAFKVKEPNINPMLALTRDNPKPRPIVIVVSEPYNMFVNVLQLGDVAD